MRRYVDWLRQAEADLRAAESSVSAGHYEWACFQMQQSAEKAAKALAEKKGRKILGHSVSFILRDLASSGELLRMARVLDRYYIFRRGILTALTVVPLWIILEGRRLKRR